MEPILGSITLFAFDWAPDGWARCDGTVLSISSNTALFSLLGTTYGGNGQTTFALPDLRGRAPIHDGSGPGLSPKDHRQVGGTESVTLAAANVAPHTHTVAATATASSKSPSGMVPAYTDGGSVLRHVRRHDDGPRDDPAERRRPDARRHRVAVPGDELLHRRRGHLPVTSVTDRP